jgi:hypothetical protein
MTIRRLRSVLRNDLSSFVRKTFGTVSPGETFLPNWHIQAITYQLELVLVGRKRRLIINQPPRSLKSITVSVGFVAWLLGRDPSLRIIVASYSAEFATELHRQFRNGDRVGLVPAGFSSDSLGQRNGPGARHYEGGQSLCRLSRRQPYRSRW